MSEHSLPVASVVIPYYGNRRKLLERTLHMLTHQTVPVQVIVGDDGDFLPYYSANDIEQALFLRTGHWLARDMLVKLRGESQAPRVMNYPVRMLFPLAACDYIILCHPENLVPLDAVEEMMAGHEPGHRDVPVVYGLDRQTTENLDDYPWSTDPHCLQQVPGFMAWPNPLRISNLEAPGNVHHFNFSGATKAEWTRWDRLVLPENGEPFNDENWMMAHEAADGVTPRRAPVTVYHQWHPALDWQGLTAPKPGSARVGRAQGEA
jgi:cellulose synthase/poly-beta-1,6-N-acetylglucosamine synthase-like glycosyltransferase